MLHLCGYDHETDDGEMLALQDRGAGRPAVTRSGFVALAGRPNAGKSTLVNAIVGDKVAIVSDKPQTTRREMRGIATGHDWQLVLVDLPGVQRPRDADDRAHAAPGGARAGRRRRARCSCSTASRRWAPGDRFIARAIAEPACPASPS